jgi:energy-coupling factor transport system substrate-specific component
MTWQAASYALLGLTLAAGFYWYERSRPPSRLVALVAALAALAALGRMAFAPVPNVKPTTDLALLAGYALGGAPGFVVGAVAALTSNFFFGQGPWTPWQMLGWGGTGLLGAGLAKLAGRDLGRWPLAAVCFVAGFAFGALQDFANWLIYSGDHSWSEYVTYNTTSFAWNLAHAVGNVAFCLLFGPALVRALRRFRTRFDVTWSPAVPLVGLVIAVPLVVSANAKAATPAAYLQSAQHQDGGWGATPQGASAPLYTAWAALAVAANGENLKTLRKPGGKTVLAYLKPTVKHLSDGGDIERTILVLGAAGVSPRTFGGRDLVRALVSHRRRNGSIDGLVNHTAFGILALKAAHARLGKSPAWLASQADRDGGFNFAGRGGASDADDTGAAIQALVAAGRRRSKAVRNAVSFLVRAQAPDGGFAATKGGPSNAQSTAFAIQGLIAARRSPDSLRHGGRTPLQYLNALTAPDGSVRYSRSNSQTPVWVTAQAELAFAGKAFPLHPQKGSFAIALGALLALLL